MFDDKTIDNIQIELLNNIDPSYEKSAGFPTYDILKSFAIEENKLYLILKSMIDKLDVDKLTGDGLTKYVLQRKGIIRKQARKAKGILIVTGNGNITEGDLFSTVNGIQFRAIENTEVVNNASVKVEAVVAGTIGNVASNLIIQMPITIAGIVSCNNTITTYDGYNEESDDSLRERYYEALQEPITSNNKYSFLRWAKEVVGVGDAKVFSNGINATTIVKALSVKVIIIDANKQPATEDLINRVQEHIDPKGENNETWGTGSGASSIGNYTTVVSATSKLINIDLVDIQEATNYTLAEITETLKENITNYLKEVAFKQNYISYAKIGNIILNTEGVEDYTDLKINNATANISIGDEEVAILGVVNVV